MENKGKQLIDYFEKNKLSDKEIKLLCKKDEKAFTHFYYYYKKIILFTITRYIKEGSIVEDLMQEVFLKIVNKINLFDKNKGCLDGWVIELTKNHVLDYIKFSKIRKYILNNEIIDEVIDNSTNYNCLYDIQGLLNDLEYNLFIYKYIFGLNRLTIVKILEINNSKYSVIYRKVKKVIKEYAYKNLENKYEK